MVVTQKEAKTKWCPDVRCMDIKRNPENARCIASAFMAWRWETNPENAYGCSTGVAVKYHLYRGYCGRAGRPAR